MRRRRAAARAAWERQAAHIREHRIRERPVHREQRSTLTWHADSPEHCVCNGTHVHRGLCPRCAEVAAP